MVQPITWRNINGPDFRGSNRLLQSAGEQVQQNIQGLAGLAQKFNTETTDENTQDVLAQIRGLNTVEGYKQAVDSGRFSQAGLGQYGDQIDQGKINAALESQLGRSEQSARQNIGNIIAQGDYTGAREAIGSSGLGDTSDLTRSILSGERAAKSRARTKLLQDQQDDAFNRVEKERIDTNNAYNLLNHKLQSCVIEGNDFDVSFR